MKAIKIASNEYPVIPKEERVKKAIELMYKKNVDRIIVSRDKDILYGIITEWDLMYKLSLKSFEMYSPYNLPLSSIATYPVDTINVDTDIKAVINIFLAKGYSSLPIVEDSKIRGIITKKEIIKYYLPRIKDRNIYIENIMDDVKGKIELFHSLRQAENKMKNSGYNSLIVHDRNRFIGIITALNIAKTIFTIKRIYPTIHWEYHLGKILVAEATIRNVNTLTPRDTLYDAAKIITYTGQKIIPVLFEDNMIAGIITRRHILRYLLENKLI